MGRPAIFIEPLVRSQPRGRAYALAGFAALLATLLAYGLSLFWDGSLSYVFQLCAVLLAALIGGWGPALLAIGLATAAAALVLPVAWPDLLLFCLAALFICALAVAIRRQVAALPEAIAARTAELEAANAQLKAEIEQREEAEAQLRHAQKMEALGQLTGGIAHDFNNLLTAIMGNLDIVQRRLPPDERTRLGQATSHALQACQRAATLTQRLLAFSHRQALDPKPTDVGRLVTGMTELLRRLLGEAIAVETRLAQELWQTQVDSNQLENVLLNLAVNARDAMPNGGKLSIETANTYLDAAAAGLAEPGDYVVLRVSDNGVGMPPEVLSRVFDPFFTTKPSGRGTGLGLSQVYGFVKQSGGHITIDSMVDVGTTITVYLPRLHHAASASAAEPPPEKKEAKKKEAELPVKPARARDSLPQRRILLVEDEPLVAMATAEALQTWGFQVQEARGVAEAEAAMRTAGEPFFLAIIDVGLPDGRGDRLAQALADRHRDLIMIVTSGYETNDLAISTDESHRFIMLTKPYEIARLKQILDRLSQVA